MGQRHARTGPFGNEGHLDLGDDIRIELEARVELPTDHRPPASLPGHPFPPIGFRTVLVAFEPAATLVRLDHDLDMWLGADRGSRGPPSAHRTREEGEGAIGRHRHGHRLDDGSNAHFSSSRWLSAKSLKAAS